MLLLVFITVPEFGNLDIPHHRRRLLVGPVKVEPPALETPLPVRPREQLLSTVPHADRPESVSQSSPPWVGGQQRGGQQGQQPPWSDR